MVDNKVGSSNTADSMDRDIKRSLTNRPAPRPKMGIHKILHNRRSTAFWVVFQDAGAVFHPQSPS